MPLGVLLVVWSLYRLRLDSDPLSLLPAGLPSVATLREHQALFPSARELLITVKAGTPEEASALAEGIAWDLGRRKDLVESTRWDTGFRESIADTVAWAWAQRAPMDLEVLEQRLEAGRIAQELAACRERLATTLDPAEIARLAYDPLGLLDVPGLSGMEAPGRAQADPFSSSDGTFRVVSVAPLNPSMPYREAAVWLGRIRGVVEEARQRIVGNPDGKTVRVAFTGYVAIMAETANGMERDLTSSVTLTLAVICLLFWVTHRSLKPLAWLVVSLLLTFLVTLALGSLVLGELNVISCGFASVMMGLVVDYALVGYQEMRACPGRSLGQIRTAVMPGILWSAATTAGTFLSLHFAGLPGLSELGTLTAMGLVVGAIVTLFWFLPRVAGRGPARVGEGEGLELGEAGVPGPFARWLAVAGTCVLMGFAVGVLALKGWPRIEGASDPLMPRNSASQEAMEELRSELGRTHKTSWLLVRGPDPESVHARFAEAVPGLEDARRTGAVVGFQLPSVIWPLPTHSRTNQATLGRLGGRADEFRSRLLEAGYGSNALHLADSILQRWHRWSGSGEGIPTWPEGVFGRWVAPMTSARDRDGSWIGRGLVETPSNREGFPSLSSGIQIAGWENLGPELLARVVGRVRVLTAAIAIALTLCLWLAFRRWTEVVLGLGALALSFGLLFTVMSLTGATWNLLNLVAIPLILGTSVDSTIHVQLALRRQGGDLRAVWRSTGVALLLCAGANIAGFGSLAWSSNAGLASLDLVCAGGVVCVLVVVLLLLPAWWLVLHRRPKGLSPSPGLQAEANDLTPNGSSVTPNGSSGCTNDLTPNAMGQSPGPKPWTMKEDLSPDASEEPKDLSPGATPIPKGLSPASKPSHLYGVWAWWIALQVARRIGRRPLAGVTRLGMRLYMAVRPDRLDLVRENLRPVVGGEASRLRAIAKANGLGFAEKLVDLWRLEAGIRSRVRLAPEAGWHPFREAVASRKGVLLVTVHLGNWELGGPLLADLGVRPLVLSAAEPDSGLTTLRAAARAHHGVDTLVVGSDPFAFVEVIRRLQEGGVVALLLDRPVGSGVESRFFGRPFMASPAAAELARATGARIFPMVVIRDAEGPVARALPEVVYDRSNVADRELRRTFTTRLLATFEEVIREHPEQWFQFVPVWKSGPSGDGVSGP